MPSKRVSKIIQIGTSSALVLPAEWLRGMSLKRGDRLEVIYNGEIRAKPIKSNEDQ